MRRLIALALGLCLWAAPALAYTLTFKTSAAANGPIHSTPTGNFSSGSGSLVIITGGISGLNASSDSVVVTDGAGNSYTVYQCPTTAGQVNVGFIAWSVLTTGLVSQAVTIADTAVGGTNATGSIQGLAWTLTGAAATSPEDIAVRACNGSTSSTTTPTVTSGAASQSGDFLIDNYFTPTAVTGFSYTADAAWTSLGAPSGGSTQAGAWDDKTNAGAGPVANNPTTTNRSYAFQIMGFKITAQARGQCVVGGGFSGC